MLSRAASNRERSRQPKSSPVPLLLLGALLIAPAFSGGCRTTEPAQPLAAGALLPSARLIVGRVLAVEAELGFAFVDLATDAPSAALIAGTELTVRTLDLRETARLQVSAYNRGRTLGTKIIAGQPSPGDEVVWLAP